MNSKERLGWVRDLTDRGCSPYYGVLPTLIKERGYTRGIEIGVLFGGHAKAILDNKDMELLIGIDPYEMYDQPIEGIESQEDFNSIYKSTMERLLTDRYWHLRMTSNEAYDVLKDLINPVDFIFIDGLHTYDQVKRDLKNYDSLIRTGGVIACHDYNHPNFPLLTNAIDEFALEHNTEVVICPFHAIYMNKTW